jgi:NitT/TauT family transport system ATP-binding protein
VSSQSQAAEVARPTGIHVKNGRASESCGDIVMEVRHLSKTYSSGDKATVAIEDVSFSVRQGEFLSIVGPSGAGKTTLLKCLSGLMPPTAGTLLFEGREYSSVPAKLTIVFQDYSRSLLPWLTVESNITLPLRSKKVPREEQRRRVRLMLEAVGLPDCAHRHPWQLSGGMQQRVAIARALAYQPDCLLMDEPFASVDAQTRTDLEDLVLRLRHEFDITIVFVTHDIDEAVYLSDRVIALSHAPSVLRGAVDVDLPSPRDQLKTKALPAFAELRSQLFCLVRGT